MSLSRYPEYYDSGTEWLGDIPSHWELMPLKWAISRIDSGTSVNAFDVPREGDCLGILKTSCVYQGWFDWRENKTVVEEELDRVSCPLKSNTLIVSRMNTPELVGATGLVDDAPKGIFLPDRLWQVSFVSKQSPRFLYYFTKSQEYRGQIKLVCSGTSSSMQNLGQDDFRGILFAAPTEPEQTQIARFLDHETAKIDNLIHEQKRLIELLKEKRQAVISHAVTRGLDPDVPMKDSGVEWLGEVPVHWQISKLSHYANLLTGFPFPSISFSQNDADVRLLRGANVGVSTLKWEDTVYWDLNKDDSLSKYIMSEGQIVIGMDRPWIGGGLRIARVTKTNMPCLLLQRVAAITATEFLDDNYLFSILQSGAFKVYVEPDLTGVSIPHLSPEQILGFTVPIPPIEEQILVFSYINEQIERNGALLDQAKFSIRLLEERRSALISAAVTGKIDVRNWQPPADESAFDEEVQQAGMEVTA